MRIMGLWYPTKNTVHPPTPADFAKMGKFMEEITKAGVLVDTGGWDPSSPSKIIKNDGDKVIVTDGPYTETKEVVAGYAIYNVKTWDDAVYWTKRFTEIAGVGHAEIRELPPSPLKG